MQDQPAGFIRILQIIDNAVTNVRRERPKLDQVLEILFVEQTGQLLRQSFAYMLRRSPDVRGRGRISGIIHKYFVPASHHPKVWASMRLGHQMLVDLRSGTELAAYYTGDYETRSIETAIKLIHPDSVILDVGANVGFWTVPLARALGAGGRLHAFEPVPANFARLGENVRRNNLEAIVRLHHQGLSDRKANVPISLREDFQNGAETGNAAIVIDSDDSRFTCTNVEVTPLDGETFRSLGIDHVDFIKLDIEGHEDKFLAGATVVFERFRPILFMEINEAYYARRGIDPSQVFEQWMQGVNYKAALKTASGWHLDHVKNRRRRFDNIFCFPSEAAEDLTNRLNE
jgi:FkbM family methyltransferase